MRNPQLPYRLVVLHDLTAVRDLLDCLENAGCTQRRVKILGGHDFAVRWRVDGTPNAPLRSPGWVTACAC